RPPRPPSRAWRSAERGDDRSRTGVRGFAGRCLSHSATSPSESEGYQRRVRERRRGPAPPAGGAGPLRSRGARSGYLPPENVCIRFSAAGPSATTNIDGKTKSTVGKSILTGAFIAF